MASVLAEARERERAAAAHRALEARAAAEARRLETIAAARAARAAEKERHRLDAELLKESKAKAAEKAAEEVAVAGGGSSPFSVADGKENSPEGSTEPTVNGGGGAPGDKAKGTAAHDAKAAIVNVSTENAEVLAMAPAWTAPLQLRARL